MAKGLMILLLMGVAPPVLSGNDCYSADAGSGELRFSGVAEGTPFRGHFDEFSVRVCMSERDPSSAEIRVIVATAAADVGNREGNEALKEEEFFHVTRYPEAVWRSSAVEPDENGYIARGELELRDHRAEQAVTLDFERADDGFRLTGGGEVMRLDWRVGTGEFEDTEFIRNRVDIEFELMLTPAG